MKDWWRNLIARLFPRPRRPIGWQSLWPLIAFVVVLSGTLAWLLISGKVAFSRPWMFAWLLLAPWVWWLGVAGYGGLGGGRAATSIFVRLLLLALLVGGLAEPRSVRVSEGVTVVYVVDVSDSVGSDSMRRIMEFVVETEAKKQSVDKAGLVAFGRNAAVELPPRSSFPYEGAINVEIAGDATNLQEAMQLAAAMIPDEERGRIVLISDGTATVGDVGETLDALAAREIAVDTLPIEYKHDHEVWVERLELPQNVKIGEAYNVSILVSSLTAEKAKLSLSETFGVDGEEEVIGQIDVDLKPGKNLIPLPIQLREAGFYEYRAQVTVEPEVTEDGTKVPRDFIEENNIATGSIFVKGQGRVLLVTDELDDARQFTPLERALRAGERLVDIVSTYQVPNDPLALMPYDCIVFNNVSRDLFNRSQVEAIDKAVYDQGIGFLMVGGDNSFGAGGWRRTPIEEMLPVALDVSEKKVLPKGALAIVLHTCEFAQGNTWAKRITKEAIRVLSDQDVVGVLAYSGMVEYVVPFTEAGNFESMVPKINSATIGDMPAFGPAMELGIKGLLETDASARHMIMISDGDPQPPSPELVQQFVDNNIRCSMVAIFPHGNIEISTMREIAGATGGNYYYPSDPNALPGIFIKEAKTLRRNLIQKRTVVPENAFPSPVLRGLSRVPAVDAYVLTSWKDRAERVLTTFPDGEKYPDEDPILGIGRYGLGATAAFTSDLSTAWSNQWVNWAEYQAFVNQLLTRISRTSTTNFLRMYTHVEGGEAIVTLEDFHPDEMFLDVKAKVSGPRDRAETFDLRQTGPRRYQATLPLWGKGRYMINVAGVGEHDGQTRTERATGGWVMPYSPEYLRFESDPITLEQVRDATGGKALSSTASGDEIFDRREPKRSSKPVFDWLLAALAILLPVDVAVRRIQLDWATVKSWFARETSPEPVRTTGALLDRASASRERERSDPAPELRKRPLPPPPKPTDAPPPTKSGGSVSASKPPPAKEPEEGSTAAKLLAMKRKRSGDDG